jgi:cytochrome c peroxidase
VVLCSRAKRRLFAWFAATLVVACADRPTEVAPTSEAAWSWDLPAGMPPPPVPVDNPMSAAKVELGRRLFFDRRLSGNGQQSCGSCHEPVRAFTDGLGAAVGSTGQPHRRGSMSLANVGYATTLTWASGLFPGLEQQALVPLFGETPVELGLAGKDDEVFARLAAEPIYPPLFAEAFPAETPAISLRTITFALAAFQRTLLSFDSPYDRATRGEGPPLDEVARRGQELFFGERLECFHCHGGPTFSDGFVSASSKFLERPFHNTGLYNLGGTGDYPGTDTGLYELTGLAKDMGRFKAPTLRNITLTAPYMHDGSIATLSSVLDHYAAGGRTIDEGPNAGEGAKNPLKDPLIRGFTLTDDERVSVLAFLATLTDDSFVNDPRFRDPWEPERAAGTPGP